MKKCTLQDAIDILYGCALLGTGGGGRLADGIELIEEDFKLGRELNIIPLNEIPDNGYIATPYGCGAPPKAGAKLPEKFACLPIYDNSPSVLAFQALESFLGTKFCAVSSTELGGENTAEALHIASELGLPIADSDPAGRSVPELQQTTYNVMEQPIYPLAVATQFGETVIVSKVADDSRAEDVVRAIAVVSNDLVGVADHPMIGRTFKKSVIPNAITYAMNIGKTIRLAKEKNEDVATAVACGFGGKVVFEGNIIDTPWECVGGFNVGEIFIKGINDYENQEYKIWMKNENIIAYRNGVVDVSVPDLICLIDENGDPVTNPDWTENMKVSILVLPSPEIWATEAGLKLLGPRSFGFDFDYKPYL